MRAGRRFRFGIESHKSVTAGIVVPAPSHRTRRDGAPHSVGKASEIKSLGHPSGRYVKKAIYGGRRIWSADAYIVRGDAANDVLTDKNMGI